MEMAASPTRSTVRAPRLKGRRPVSRSAIADVVRQIVKGFGPEKIILFGSYAHGQPGPESDVDLLVVLESGLGEADQATRICQAIEYHFGLDLIVRTPATLARRLALGDTFLREALATGKVLYARADG